MMGFCIIATLKNGSRFVHGPVQSNELSETIKVLLDTLPKDWDHFEIECCRSPATAIKNACMIGWAN